jgi:hypothetical protein
LHDLSLFVGQMGEQHGAQPIHLVPQGLHRARVVDLAAVRVDEGDQRPVHAVDRLPDHAVF